MTDHYNGHESAATDADQQGLTLRERRQQAVRQNTSGPEHETVGPGTDSTQIGRRADNDYRAGTGSGEPPGQPVQPLTHVPPGSSHPRGQAKKAPTDGGALRKLAGAVSALSDRLRGGSASVHDAAARATHPQPGSSGYLTDSADLTEEQWERELKLSLREAELGDVARVCIGSPKGGIGKSSLAYAFAGAVARYTNLRVALVDVDPNFGSLRTLVPRPIQASVLDLAYEANEIKGLSQIRNYVAKNDRMGLDVVLGPTEEYELAAIEDLGAVYKAADAVLSDLYNVVVYDMGVGFRDPAIREVLAFCDEFVLAVDAEQVTNTMVSRAIKYLETLQVGLSRNTTTLVINHLCPPEEESARATYIREAHSSLIDRITEIPYDPLMSQLLNDRSFDIEDLSTRTRLRVLITVGAFLKGLGDNRVRNAAGTCLTMEQQYPPAVDRGR